MQIFKDFLRIFLQINVVITEGYATFYLKKIIVADSVKI